MSRGMKNVAGYTSVAVSKELRDKVRAFARRHNLFMADVVSLALVRLVDGDIDADDLKRRAYEIALRDLQTRLGYKP